VVRVCDNVVWFDFKALGEGPRSQNDYVSIAREFQSVLVSDVPVFSRAGEDAARRFIALVDEFYDRRVKLVLSAAGWRRRSSIRGNVCASSSNARPAD
jgi:cell division protein ZapE